MVFKDELSSVLNNMIFSASGWRGVFAQRTENIKQRTEYFLDEEAESEQISFTHKIICAAAAYVFADYLKSFSSSKNLILLGNDTRPTGKMIIETMISVLLSAQNELACEISYAGVTAAPEIMAWARSKAMQNETRAAVGYIYISASHNPIGHNGIKFGLSDGGVLTAEEADKLIKRFMEFINNDDCAAKIESLINSQTKFAQTEFAKTEFTGALQKIYNAVDTMKEQALKAYYDFCSVTAWGNDAAQEIKSALTDVPLGIVCDFNGSARTVSIDKEFFSALGFKFECINEKPGQIVHRIVPEGDALHPCCELLKKNHDRDASFVLGYVPDCDGDRGNLVIWDNKAATARALGSQEVFALACLAEFSHLVWTGDLSYDDKGKALNKVAIAINDPTSMRIDRIAEFFGISVFRAEVGEANVVSLARKLREQGYIVRILGEGSAGGNITHPSAVRDPINTVLAIAKLLLIGDDQSKNKKGFFSIWCQLSGHEEKYRGDFSITDIIESLPQFASTPAYSENAVLRIKTQYHSVLKDRYQQIFLREWELQKDQLKKNDIYSWEAIAYNGIKETRNLQHFADALKGGLKILFKNNEGREIAYIWMRGSATEPVFRIMADAEKANFQLERDLLEWQKKMIIEADGVSNEPCKIAL